MNKKDKEFEAYVYQQLQDLEMYTHKDTVLTVLEKNCKKTIKKMADNDEVTDHLKDAKHCIAIKLEDTETGMKIEGIGFGQEPYTAVRDAKEKLLKTLNSIHDKAITPQERVNEVNEVINRPKFLN